MSGREGGRRECEEEKEGEGSVRERKGGREGRGRGREGKGRGRGGREGGREGGRRESKGGGPFTVKQHSIQKREEWKISSALHTFKTSPFLKDSSSPPVASN